MIVLTVMIPNVKTDTLMPIIRQKVKPDSIVYTDTLRSYNTLGVSEFKHYRINHSKRFHNKHNHINGIENFWNQVKRPMRRYNGILREHFHLFLKECEWRFNNSDPKSQLIQLNHWISYLGRSLIVFIGIQCVYILTIYSEFKQRPYTIIRQIYTQRESEIG